MFEEVVDVDEHWSYTVMGNWRAGRYYESLFRICLTKITTEDRIKATEMKRSVIEKNLVKRILEASIDELTEFVRTERSRLAYLVLGVLLMRYGAIIPSKVTEEILKYTSWEFEEFQFKTEEEKSLRKKFLLEFREKLNNHIESVCTEVSHEALRDVYKDHGPFNLTPIKYEI